MKVTIDVNLYQLEVLVESLKDQRTRYHQMIINNTSRKDEATKKCMIIADLMRQFEDNPNA